MSTNAVIRIRGVEECEIYKHWDGGPESTLQWLEDFNNDFEKNRPDDPTYKFAQLLRSSIAQSNEYNLDDSKYTGWGSQ